MPAALIAANSNNVGVNRLLPALQIIADSSIITGGGIIAIAADYRWWLYLQ